MPASTAELIQFGGVVVSFFVVIMEILTLIRDWRGGSPELRLVKEHLISTNKQQISLLRKIVIKLGDQP